MRFARFAVLVTSLVLIVVTLSLGQMETATLSGKVTDQKGAVVPGAQLMVTDVETNVSLRGVTNELGLYVLSSLKPGHYRVTVSKEAFKTINLSDLVLTVQDAVSRNFELQVGSANEFITVVADAADVRMSPAVSTVVNQKLVGELPLNGRSFQTLFQLTPGAVITPTSANSQGQFVVNGQRANANYFMVDGAGANAGVGSVAGSAAQMLGGSLPPFSAQGGTNSLVSTEAVQEFAIQTSSFAPEFGRTPGAQVSIVTKSGTNMFHGAAFDYLRNDALDANDWFANHNGLKRAELRQNDFGAVLGGPIFKDKTFFFLSYEGLRLRQPTTGLSDVPTLAVRNAAPPSIQPFFNAYPIPTGLDEGNGLAPGNYTFSNPSSLNAGSIRIDHHLGESLTIFGRYDYAPSEAKTRGALRTLNTTTATNDELQTVTLGLTYVVNPRTTQDARFNWTRALGKSSFGLDNFGGAVPVSPLSFLPSFCTKESCLLNLILSEEGMNSILEFGTNVANVQHQINFIDNVSWQAGGHLVKVGVDYRRLTPDYNPATYIQIADFTTIQAALGSAVDDFGEISARAPVHAAFDNFSIYGQDTWRPTTKLSVSYGLRWDFNPAPSGQGSDGLHPFTVQNLNNPASLSLAPAGTPIYHATRDNFAPRLGVAYLLRSSSTVQTVIRAGGGVFFDLGNGPVGSAFQLFPFTALKDATGQNFPYDATVAAPPPISAIPAAAAMTVFPNTLKLPYTYEFNASVEQAIGANQTFTLGYVGAIGHSLLRQTQFSSTVLPPAFSSINFVDNSGYSKYNALQAQFRRRATSGLDILGSYTFAHTLDNSSSDANIAIPGQFLSPRVDYGPSDFDIRHTGTAGFDYELPLKPRGMIVKALASGWSIGSVLTARSAPPVNVTVFRNIGFGTYSFRPDLIAGVPLYVNDGSLPGGKEINLAALAASASPRQGDLGRNFFRGFALVQSDVTLRRRFRLTERLALGSRIEVFNIFNHPNFSPPTGSLGVVTAGGTLIVRNGFGISPSMLNQGLGTNAFGAGFNPLYQLGGPRSMQLSLKLEF
jgi:hypothetical protein